MPWAGAGEGAREACERLANAWRFTATHGEAARVSRCGERTAVRWFALLCDARRRGVWSGTLPARSCGARARRAA